MKCFNLQGTKQVINPIYHKPKYLDLILYQWLKYVEISFQLNPFRIK